MYNRREKMWRDDCHLSPGMRVPHLGWRWLATSGPTLHNSPGLWAATSSQLPAPSSQPLVLLLLGAHLRKRAWPVSLVCGVRCESCAAAKD